MRLAIRSCAKINLFLDILRRRADGFHDLHTLFHLVDLADDLAIEILENPPSDGQLGTIAIEGPAADGVPTDEANLAWKALAALQQETGLTLPPLRMTLHKRIPNGAGLGGASSNAVAALRLGNKILGAPLSRDHLLRLAAQIGSDCAFFLCGDAAAEGGGRGEILTPAPALALPCLIVLPGFPVSTREAYGRLTPEMLGPRSDVAALRRWLAGGGEGPVPRLGNTFETALNPLHPEISAILESLTGSGAIAARLSGSGSASFALFREAEDARAAAANLSGQVHVTRLLATAG